MCSDLCSLRQDPKEYLPFLNGLRALPEPQRRYKVDMHLRRWASALRHLAAAGADHLQEALKLITDHDLYLTGLQLYPPGSAQHRVRASRSWMTCTGYRLTDKANCKYYRLGQ